MKFAERVSPPSVPASAGEPPRLCLAREFGETTLCLRLPEGDSFELNQTAALWLRGHAAASWAEGDGAKISAALGPHRDWVARALATGVEAPAAFRSPQWDAPADFAPPPYPSLPDEKSWLLLVAATARAPRAGEAWCEWRSRVPQPTRLARRLMPVIAANLAAQQVVAADVVDTDLLARRHWRKTTIALHALAPVLHALAAAGVRVALVKGLASALLDYGDLALRPMTDVDLVVPFAERRRAMDVLAAAGFRAHDPVDERLAPRVHGGAYVRPPHLNLDLHWHALWANCWPGADRRFWATVRPLTLHGAPAGAPSPEMRLLMACVHGLRHQPVPTHHWAVDAATILTRHGKQLDWDWLLAEARARRVTRTLREACGYLVRALGAPLERAVWRRLERAPPAVFENLIFESYQWPFPTGGSLRATLVSWLNQYRVAARGFRPWELRDFFTAMRLARGQDSTLRFVGGLVRGALQKIVHRRDRRPAPSVPA